jgi:hypothetical protein
MKLESVVPWGRSLAEYRAMFALSENDLQRRILGCGDGPASFNAEANSSERRAIVSVDPIYGLTATEITLRIAETEGPMMENVRANAATFRWRWFEKPDALLRARRKAMSIFLEDYEIGKEEKRYVPGALPNLDFPDDSFELCLCSHLLFLYSSQLTTEFHFRSVVELLRLAPEVRIFPLRDLDHDLSLHLEPVSVQLRENGSSVELVLVDYEFIPEGNRMLVVRRGYRNSETEFLKS